MIEKIIYTDGSAQAKNLNFGGWAFCEIDKNQNVELQYGYQENADSNTMELMAVIKALEFVESKGKIKIISDSQYVIHGVESKLKNKTAIPKKLKDVELWNKLKNLVKNKHIIWEWVRSHQKDEINNYIDEVARATYSEPNKIPQIQKDLNCVIQNKLEKVQVGDLIWTHSKSQKYVVVINHIIVANKIGFLVKLLANRYGREYIFIEKNEKINLVKEKTNKEIGLIEDIIKSFKG